MTQYWGRVDGGVAVEVIQIPDDAQIGDRFTPQLVATMHQWDSSLQIGWLWDGSAFSAPPAPTPTPDQLLQGKLNAGIDITSSNTGLNGNYLLDPGSQATITGLIALIGAGGTLPSNPIPYPDSLGAPHMFSPSELTALAGAIGTYIFGLRTTWAILKNGGSASWPSLPVTI